MNDIIVKMVGISKAFAGIKALSGVDLELKQGEVHALMGENGAGKSTLMKILTGIHTKDAGEIFLANEKGELEKIEIKSPLMAQHLGISMVFQEFNLLENMTIADNIYLGREPISAVRTVDKQLLLEKTKDQLQKVELNIDPLTKIEDLSCGQKQTVEIAKCLSFNARVIILDEPTASLTDIESQVLFKLINELRRKGVSIVYISHRMEEVFRLADRITVFRDGTYIGTVEAKDTKREEIIKMMIGREINTQRMPNPASIDLSQIVLEVKNVKVYPKSRPLNFKLYKHEILGLFGLVGAGRTELARIIFGIDPIQSGEIIIHGKKIEIKRSRDAIKSGIGLVPEDRKGVGLILGMSVKDNMLISKLGQLKSEVLNKKKLSTLTGDYIKNLRIALASEDQEVKELSGGNQQKVVIAKWLAMEPDILILDEPTRGIDIGAKSEIYELMHRMAAEGKSIIMISSEMEEIMRISDRVLVMHEGSLTGEMDANEASQETIMNYAIGG